MSHTEHSSGGAADSAAPTWSERTNMSTGKKDSSRLTPEAPDFEPIRVLDVDVSQPLPAISATDPQTGRGYRRANALVRIHTQPIGTVALQFDENGMSAAEYARQIWSALGREIQAHLRADGLPEIAELGAAGLPTVDSPKCTQGRERLLADAPLVSVIVATRDRPERIAVCLQSLLSLDYPHYEIIVVDNAPSTDATARLIEQSYGNLAQVRYVREDRPGNSWARNTGLLQARAEIVAFVDDDVILDSHWLAELVQGFDAAENVACVTGMIVAAELDTPSQVWIEQYGGFSKGFARRVFDMAANRPTSPLYPYNAGIFGSGANMAFRASILREIGGFDPGLGSGSLARGGEDLAAYFDAVSKGYRLVYQPAAIVHHWHYREYERLCRQVYGYGMGLTAYLTKCLLDNPRRVIDLTIRVPYGLFFAFSSRSPKNVKKAVDYPSELTRIERRGMLAGPVAYIRSRWRVRRMGKRLAAHEAHTVVPATQ
jgi:glycosyltransferase involved in cell wall biosynthesis